jgi:hypothetical protein
MFTSQCWTRGASFIQEPRINPIIKFIPQKYFYLLENKIDIDHESWYDYKTNHNLTNDDLDFMLDTYHDTDSYKDWNPLYYMVSRPETKIWYNDIIKVDKSKFGISHNILLFIYDKILNFLK